MNLSQMQYVLMVEKSGSFSEAARICCVTQPTLSNGIARLEAELGGRLFQRTTRSVTLTRFGAYMLPMIKTVMTSKEELEASAKSFFRPENRILRMGLSPLINSTVFNQALLSLKQQNLWPDIFVKHCFLDDLDERLMADLVDIAFLPRQSGSCPAKSLPLYEEALHYIPPQANPAQYSGKPACLISDLENCPVILTSGCGLSDVIADLFAEEKTPLTPYPGQALNYSVVTEWAELGIASGILPVSKIPKGPVISLPLHHRSGKAAMVQYEAAWNPNAPDQEIVYESVSRFCKISAALATGSS
ncbi:MAG: LysR family transcriptional regulator [Sneathiella sp.]